MGIQRHVSRRPSDGRQDLDETMSGLTDRPDLECLFERQVAMPQILRLAGKGIRTEAIQRLLEGPDPARALKTLLGR